MAKAKRATGKSGGDKGGVKTPKQDRKEVQAKARGVNPADLEALRKSVEEAKGHLEAAREEAKAATERAKTLVGEATTAYHEALAPYRGACRKAGVKCEFEGGRGTNVSERVGFVVEKMEKGVRVMVKGKPKTEEVIPLSALKESVNKAAYAYTDKHVGSREEVGNKGGSLSNRLRVAIKA